MKALANASAIALKREIFAASHCWRSRKQLQDIAPTTLPPAHSGTTNEDLSPVDSMWPFSTDASGGKSFGAITVSPIFTCCASHGRVLSSVVLGNSVKPARVQL